MSAPFPAPTPTWHTKSYPSLSPNRPELSAKGKTVVITGGGSGIGAETAQYFAAAGASRIALLGRREQPLLNTKASIEGQFPGIQVFAKSTDVTKKSEVELAFATFLGDGKVNVLVSNAAVIGPHESVNAKMDSEKFLEGIQRNLSGTLYVAQAFLRYAAPDAVAINVSSFAAHLHSTAKLASYSIAKSAIVRLWDNLGCGHPEMSVFHVHPGVVDTEINREVDGIAAVGYEDDGEYSVYLFQSK